MFKPNAPKWFYTLLALGGLSLVSFSTQADTPPALLKPPVSFAGNLPCADCEGIRWHVDLLPDSSFFLRMTYLGKAVPASFDEIGRWSYRQAGNRIILQGPRTSDTQFSLTAAGNLKKLDQEGNPIESKLNYELQQQPGFTPIEPRLPLSGMYTYFADSGHITLCDTGQRIPVAQEADNAQLERMYISARGEPVADQPPLPLLVTVDGRIAQRMPMEGPGPRPTLIVERFHAVWPGLNCASQHRPPSGLSTPLTTTQWTPLELNVGLEGQPLTIDNTVGKNERTPYIQLEDSGKVQGFSGCNRLMGSYTLKDNTLTFGAIATTRMACTGEAGRYEQHLLQTLGQIQTWAMLGDRLQLYNAEGHPVLLLKSLPQ